MQEESGIAESPPPNEAEVLELLRTPKLSIKNLDPATKEKIRKYILWKHIEQGVSLSDIAKLIGSKTSGYTSWLTRQLGIQARPFEEARLDGIHKKVRKYERRPFDGTDEDKAYLLGVSHGDFSASVPFADAVRVSTSTTHPVMVELFKSLFEKYGHVYQHPRYKKDTNTYEWNLSTILDASFSFLLEPRTKCREWILTNSTTILAYLAGLFDAEGTVGIYPNARTTSVQVLYYNTDLDLLHCVHEWLVRLGYHALEPYLDKAIGFRSPGFHIEMKKDYFRVLVATFEDAQRLLLRLPLRHTERVALKGFALSIKKGTLWSDVGPKRDALRKSIDDDVESFTKQAEQQYLKTHPPRSNPVLCLLQSSIRQSGQDEHVEKQLESLRGYLAVHVEEQCLVDEPCVMLCKGCDEQNIVSILVHESIHHALLWMSDDFLNPLDPLDSIVPSMNRRGFREEGFLLYG